MGRAGVPLGHPRHGAVEVGQDRQDDDQAQVGIVAQGIGEVSPDFGTPEVLVLDVDQPSSIAHRLGVAQGDRSLTIGREVVGHREERRVGARDLDDVRRSRDRRRRRPLLPEGIGILVLGLQPGGEPATGVGGQRSIVLPALPEGRLDVVDRGAPDGDLDVVPRRVRAVLGSDGQGLGIAPVTVVVAPRVAEVDAPGVGDVPGRVVAVPQHHELLVVGTTGANSHVPQAFPAVRLQGLAQLEGPLRVEAELAPVRPPQQPAHVDPAPQRRDQDVDEGVAGVVELLVGVAAPVHEVDPVPLTHRRDPVGEVGEVGRPVHQRGHLVAEAPCGPVRAHVVDTGVRIASLRSHEQPVA